MENKKKKKVYGFVMAFFLGLVFLGMYSISMRKTKEDVEDKLEEVEKDLDYTKDELREQKKKYDQLYDLNILTKDQRDSLKAEIKIYIDRVEKLEKLIASSENLEPKEFFDLIEKQQKEIEDLKSIVVETQEKNQINNEKAYIDKIESLKEEVVSLKKQAQKKDALIAALTTQVSTLQQERNLFRNLLEQEKEKNRKNKAEIRRLENEGIALNQKITTQDSVITIKKEEITELDDTIKEKQEDIKNKGEAIKEIAKNSFSATYRYKGTKRKSVPVKLGTTANHRAKWVREILIHFTVDTEIAPNGQTLTYLSIYKKSGEPVENYKNKTIEIKNYQAEFTLKLKDKLEEGFYYFLVTHNDIEILRKNFKIHK